MKTATCPPSRSLPCATQATAILIGLVLNCAASPQATAEVSSAPKDHVLFVGTDLAVKEGKEFYHVVGAKKDTLQVAKGHRISEVRLGQGANIRVSRGVKLSNLSATISNIQTESVDRVSARAQLAAMQSAMALDDNARDQEDRLHGNMMMLSAVAIDPQPDRPNMRAYISRGNLDAMQASASASYIGALPDLDRMSSAASTLLTQNQMRVDPIDDEITLDASALPGLKLLGGSDVGGSGISGSTSNSLSQGNVSTSTAEVELTFEVSSPAQLEHAYIVVVANYGSSSKPDQVARQISTKQFGHIDSHPQRVKMKHAASINGLPFKRFDMGLYANGQEVATNLSEKRLALTSDQAFQFFLLDYLSTHKGATLPPTPLLMTPRSEFRQQVEKIDGKQKIYANVDKMGKVLGISADPAGIQPLPAALESPLRNVRFMPALEKGAPVDGRVEVTLGQLAN
jgi:hypothetical protein